MFLGIDPGRRGCETKKLKKMNLGYFLPPVHERDRRSPSATSVGAQEQRGEPLVQLASWARRRSQELPDRTFVIAIVGLPGCGKSTLREAEGSGNRLHPRKQ